MSPLDDVGLSIVERPTPEDEAELVAACLAGDVAAQRALFRREFGRVNATIYRILGPTREVDDLVQETFIAVFRGLAKFRGEARLATWIDRIAVRVALDHVRTRKAATVPLGVIGDELTDASIPDAQAHARDGLRRLYAALAQLSPDARTAFALYAIDGRSIAEVARLVGTTVVTAKVRIWRARRELMKRAAEDPVLKELL
ncbi:MAG TPA: RNA polymerase sigma factor [Kofleriaceae bacterium]|nr:RNA polymerase sigma factor [Kofleriaceae bacterium]